MFSKLRLWPASIQLLNQCKEGYDMLDVKDKIVLDIGLDWGNSALYWWLRGAKTIIGFESNTKCFSAIRTLQKRGLPLEFHGPWTGNEYPEADVLKIDIEGFEKYFRVGMLDKYPSWAFATHNGARFLDRYLQAAGGKLIHEQEDEKVWYRIS